MYIYIYTIYTYAHEPAVSEGSLHHISGCEPMIYIYIYIYIYTYIYILDM